MDTDAFGGAPGEVCGHGEGCQVLIVFDVDGGPALHCHVEHVYTSVCLTRAGPRNQNKNLVKIK